MDRLARKHAAAAAYVPAPVIERRDGATIGVVTLGGCDLAVREALRPAGARPGSPPTTCASAASRSATRSRPSSPPTSTASSSSRTATRSCAALLVARDGGPQGEAALDPRLRRLPAVRPAGRRRRAQLAVEEWTDDLHHEARHPAALRCPTNKLGLTVRDYEGAMSTLCAGCGHDSITAAIVRAFYELDDAAAHGRQALGHRLLVQDADVLRLAAPTASTRRTGACRPSRPGATAANRELTYIGDQRRRRLALDRPRPAVPRHPPQRQHALRHREQRRLRPDQGPVLGLGRRRARKSQARRGQHASRRSIR